MSILRRIGNAFRADSWTNFWTGLGTARDKTEFGDYQLSAKLTDPELSALYHTGGIPRKIVNLVPREMLRKGFGVTCPEPQAAQAVSEKLKTLDALNMIREGFILGRLFGGSVIMIGADDGQNPSLPLDESRILSLRFLQVFDRRRVQPETYYQDPTHQKYGEPAVYRLSALRTGAVSYVHETRLIVFRGAHTAAQERLMLTSWDYSVLQAPYNEIRQFSMNHKSVEYMMTDASQGVFKMRGLLRNISEDKLEDIQTRAQLLDMSRSIARAVMLDADGGEEFTKVQTSFAGVKEVLDASAQMVSAVTNIPVAVLLGKVESGLNATAEGPIRLWYADVDSDREQDLKPRLERLVKIAALSLRMGDQKFGILFKPLWEETAKEKAEREKLEAETAAIWITGEVLSPDEVSVARFSGDEVQPYRINPKSRIVDPTLKASDIPGARVSPPPGPPAAPPGPQGATGPVSDPVAPRKTGMS